MGEVCEKPSPEQYLRLEQAGQLQLFESPEWLRATNGRVTLKFDLPRHGVSLLKLSTLLTKLSSVDRGAESVPRAIASDGFANSRSLPLAVLIRTIVEQLG
jgi:hypothetical protein